MKLLLSAVAVLAVSGSCAHGQTVMKLATATINDPQHEWLNAYKSRIEEKTQGRIKAEIYPAGQLGSIPRMVEGLQLGTVELFLGPSGFFKGVNTAFQVTEAPGLMGNLPQAAHVFADPTFREPFLALGEAKGIVGIGIFPAGTMSYASVKPIRTLEDFRGKKIRVLATKIETESMARLGAAGVPVDLSEVSTALQSGALDGIRSSIIVMNGMKLSNIAKYLTVVDETMVPVVAFVSKPFLDKLPAADRAAVFEAGRALDGYGSDISLKFYAEAEKVWQGNGGELIRYSAKDRAEHLRRIMPIAEELFGGPGADEQTRKLYEALKAAVQRHPS